MEQKLYFTNSKGEKLCGILSDPKPGEHIPVAILCHGYESSKESKTYTTLQMMLNKQGIATFRFDFFGHGESEGKLDEITITQAVDDVRCAMAFMQSKGYTKLGLCASSFGGIACLHAAVQTNDLSVLVLRSPVSDYSHRLPPAAQTKTKKFMEDAKKFDVADLRHIAIPTIIVHGDADDSVPLEQSKRTAALIKGCELVIMKGADHKFSKQDDGEKCLQLLVGFLVRHLA